MRRVTASPCSSARSPSGAQRWRRVTTSIVAGHRRRDSPIASARPAPTSAGARSSPADNAWNQDVSQAPLHPQLGRHHRLDPAQRRRLPAPRLRREPRLRHPVRRRARQPAAGADHLHAPTATRATPARSRSRSTHRSRVARARPATATCSWCGPRRASCSSSFARSARSGWEADSGARFDLASNALRPLGWTSADAAGLPILPGLVRYDEVAAGEIRHAIRVTFSATQRGYILAGDPLRLVGHRSQSRRRWDCGCG